MLEIWDKYDREIMEPGDKLPVIIPVIIADARDGWDYDFVETLKALLLIWRHFYSLDFIEHLGRVFRLINRSFPEVKFKDFVISYFTGGMPEAVQCCSSDGGVDAVREIQRDILSSYVLDFAKYAASPDIPKLRRIWDSIPSQLAKANKKFVFSLLKKSARMRDFENAIEWLEKSGLIHRVFRVKAGKRPLKAYAEENIFKMYALDVGLLGALADIPPDILVRGDSIFREYEGAFVENYVVQELKASKGLDLYYWESSGTAEVDFVCEGPRSIYPLEAKAGVNSRSKSLASFDQKYAPPFLGRASLMNLGLDGRVLNFPLYATSRTATKNASGSGFSNAAERYSAIVSSLSR